MSSVQKAKKSRFFDKQTDEILASNLFVKTKGKVIFGH